MSSKASNVIKIFKVGSLIYIGLALLSIPRLIDVPGMVHLSLYIFHALNIIIIFNFLTSGTPIKIRLYEILIFIWIAFCVLNGMHGNNNKFTLISDTLMYVNFVILIIIYRSTLYEFHKKKILEQEVRKIEGVIIKFSIFVAIFAFIIVSIINQIKPIYFQSPTEKILPASFALANGDYKLYLVFVLLGLLSNKRAEIVSLIFMGLTYFFVVKDKNRKSKKIFKVLVILFLTSLVYVALNYTKNPIVDKINTTYQLLEKAVESADTLENGLSIIDPGRYIEYISLRDHIESRPLIGSGFGFRYEFDSEYSIENAIATEGSVTNAHFTPLGIVSKQGFIGLFLWSLLIINAISKYRIKSGFVAKSGLLGLIGVSVDSIFSFGFFINFFAPLYISMLTIGHGSNDAGISK